MKIFIELTQTKFLNFNKYKEVSKKTYDIVVLTKDHHILGIIKWRAGWRRYVFEPESETVFDSSCLKEITNYIDELMSERKKK